MRFTVEKEELLRNKYNLKIGDIVVVANDPDNTPYAEGKVTRVLSFNRFEAQIQVTHVLDNTGTAQNPYILESECGYKVTREEFENAEFVHERYIRPVDFGPKFELDIVKRDKNLLLGVNIISLLAIGIFVVCRYRALFGF